MCQQSLRIHCPNPSISHKKFLRSLETQIKFMIAKGAAYLRAYSMSYNLNNSYNWFAQELKTLKAVIGLREQVNLLEWKLIKYLAYNLNSCFEFVYSIWQKRVSLAINLARFLTRTDFLYDNGFVPSESSFVYWQQSSVII